MNVNDAQKDGILQEAYHYGRSARVAGMPAIPALDREFIGSMAGKDVADVYWEWLRGWMEAD